MYSQQSEPPSIEIIKGNFLVSLSLKLAVVDKLYWVSAYKPP